MLLRILCIFSSKIASDGEVKFWLCLFDVSWFELTAGEGLIKPFEHHIGYGPVA